MPPTKYTDMSLTTAEVHLILRLRQLRNHSETRIFMVTTTPLTLSVMGDIELLDAPCYSGSGVMG